MPAPLISICIPAYRAEKYLPSTLESIRTQTFTDWEIIVTEDGTKDRTEEIVRAFARQVTQSVTYNRHEKNRGLPATRNTGIATARGTWVAFLDSDDLWKPEHLAQLVEAARSGDCDLAYSSSEIFDDATGNILEIRAPSAEALAAFPLSLYDSRLIIQPSSVMVLREGFSRFGLVSEAYPICNDMEYWLRVASGGGRFAYTGNATCRYRKHGEAMSLKSAALIAEAAQICEAYARWPVVPPALRRSRPASLYRDAARIMLKTEPHRARKFFGKSLGYEWWSPTNLTGWIVASVLALAKRSS